MDQPSPFATVAGMALCLAVSDPARAFPNPFSHSQTTTPATGATTATATAISDIAADPSVRLGALANGLRYAIVKATGASGQASLRLRFDIGTDLEGPDEQGFTQILARLPFDHQRPPAVSRRGAKAPDLKFNADDNADAAFDATTFSLDFATADTGSFDAALGLMRSVAGEPKFSQADADAEWGVVLTHERASNDIAYRLFKARVAFLLEGQRPALGYVAGKAPLAAKVKRGPIEAFHARYYRPENAILVAAGDIDPDVVEANIRARFGDWRGSGAAGAKPDPGAVEARGAQTRLFVEAGAPSTIQLSWVGPPDRTPDGLARRRRETIERLALAVLNRRLSDRTATDDSPFASAAALRADQFGAAGVTSLIIGATPEHWRAALAAADQVQRGATTWGVTADELAAARGAVDAELKDAADNVVEWTPATVADTVAASLATGESATSPAQDLALFDQAASGVTADQVSAALKGLFEGQGPLVFMSSPEAIEGGEGALASAYATDRAAALAQRAPAVLAPAANAAFGEIGKQADRRDLIDLDAVFIRFENGVRLTVKPTKFRDGQVDVKVRVGGDARAPGWALKALVDGGTAKIAVERDAIALTATSSRDDLEDTLRAIAGPIVGPVWRPEAFERARKAASEQFDHDGASAAGVLARELPGLLGDPPWAAPDQIAIKGATVEELKQRVDPMLQAGPLEVIVVGDITVEKAFDAVAETFAALPPRPAPGVVTSDLASPPSPTPSPTPLMATHAGRSDDSEALMAWRTDDLLADPREARAVQVLGAVLQARLGDAGVAAKTLDTASLSGSPWGDLTLTMTGAPDTLPGLFAQASKTVADLRARDITPDQLQRAKTAVSLPEEAARKVNDHWLDLLSGAQDDPRRLAVIRSQDAAVERVTTADVRAAAQRYLRDDAVLKAEVKPAGS